jgi:hypothetical protein
MKPTTCCGDWPRPSLWRRALALAIATPLVALVLLASVLATVAVHVAERIEGRRW